MVAPPEIDHRAAIDEQCVIPFACMSIRSPTTRWSTVSPCRRGSEYHLIECFAADLFACRELSRDPVRLRVRMCESIETDWFYRCTDGTGSRR